VARGARLREDLRGLLRQPRERQDVEAGGGCGVVGGEDLQRDVRHPLVAVRVCRRFETGGSQSRRVSVLRAPAQMGRARGRARRGERRGGRSRA
jgi:hypothetical protein